MEACIISEGEKMSVPTFGRKSSLMVTDVYKRQIYIYIYIYICEKLFVITINKQGVDSDTRVFISPGRRHDEIEERGLGRQKPLVFTMWETAVAYNQARGWVEATWAVIRKLSGVPLTVHIPRFKTGIQ